MEAYRIDHFGSVGGIVLRSSKDPRPGPEEILMRVRASSLNYRDLMVLKGGGRGQTKLGVVPLSDGAGEVAAIGEGVTRIKIGDRIAGCFHPRWFGGPIKPDYLTDRLGANLDGMLAEYAVLSEEALVHPPSHLSFEEAATLPCAAVTAWVALTGHRQVTAGDTVLTQGSGGVSVFALQFAQILGARVIATTSTAEKGERLKALGASEAINYIETPDWDEKARTDRWPRRRLRRRDRRTWNDLKIAEGLGRGRTCQPDRREPVAIGNDARPLTADRPWHYRRCDQRRTPRRFRGGEPGHRTASLAPRDRPDIPVRRGHGSLPAFRGPRSFRQGRVHARLRNRMGGHGASLPRTRRLTS